MYEIYESSIIHPANITNQPYGENRNKNTFDVEPSVQANVIYEGYFYIDRFALTSPEIAENFQQEFPEFNLQNAAFTNFWQVFVTAYTESHSDGHSTVPTFSDVFVGFGMGANPIQVSINGFVACNPDYNCKIDFLTFYNLLIRGTRQKATKVPIYFQLFNTLMAIRLTSLEVSTESSMPDFNLINLQGVGYKYEIRTTTVK